MEDIFSCFKEIPGYYQAGINIPDDDPILQTAEFMEFHEAFMKFNEFHDKEFRKRPLPSGPNPVMSKEMYEQIKQTHNPR
jgi:hypothetical protein